MLDVLKRRFEDNRNRHPELSWEDVERRLLRDQAALAALRRTEESGGEPDVVVFEGRLLLCDCAREAPPAAQEPVL